MRLLRNIKIFVAAAMLAAACSRGTDEPRKQIFVFYDNPSTRGQLNFQSVDNALRKAFGENSQYETVMIPFYMSSFEDDVEIETTMVERTRELIKEGRKPWMFLVLGDRPADIMAMSEDSLFRTLPVVFMNIQAPELVPEVFHRKNMTGRWIDWNIRKNIDFIRVTGGESFVVTQLEGYSFDSILDSRIRRQLTDTMKYRYDADHSNPGRLLSRSERNQERMVIIPVSMLNKEANVSRKDSINSFDYQNLFDCHGSNVTFLQIRNGESSNRVFRGSLWRFYTMLPEHFNLSESSYISTCVGGYFTPYSEMAKEARVIADSLSAGYTPEQLVSRPHKADYWIDWREYAKDGEFASDFPGYIHFVNLPWYRRNSFYYWLHNGGFTILGILLTLAFAFMLVIMHFVRKLEEQNLIARGEEAINNNKHIASALSVTNSILWRFENGIIIADESAKSILGITKNKYPLDKLLEGISDEDVRNDLVDALTQFDKNSSSISMTVPVVLGSLPLHTFEILISYSVHDGVLMPMGTMTLIDDELEREKSIRESLEMEEQSQMREAFLASMGHEIRTPINAIVGFSNLIVDMRNEMSAEEMQNWYQLVESNLEQLLALLDNVMNYSAESDELKKSMITIPVAEMVDELYKTHSVIVPKHLKFFLEKGDIEARIHVSRTSIRQIVSNLVNNACKFTPSGHVTLGWTADESHVSIYVEDTGIGLSPEDLENIFSLYFKKDFTTDGAGIGLSLCSKLAQAMDGELSAKSTLGKGSRFILTLPRV